jgi:hypothetical protein
LSQFIRHFHQIWTLDELQHAVLGIFLFSAHFFGVDAHIPNSMPSQRRIAFITSLLVLLGRLHDSDGFAAPKSRRPLVVLRRRASSNNNDNDFIDAVVEDSSDSTSAIQPQIPGKLPQRKRQRDMFTSAIQRLAQLSLEDYKWRSSIFKSQEADRLVEESVARMRGEEAAYLRPMDATDRNIGPLGKAEKIAVGWLSKVIEEEGKRAEMIAKSDGNLVRPMDASGGDEPGPLATIEKAAVNFFDSILDAENERFATGTMRPKDLEVGKRGPLGEAEAKAVAALAEIKESETLRMAQSRVRGGEMVRPIDVPGPLGELERTLVDVFIAEQQRVKDRKEKEGTLIRPKDATVRGPLGEAEIEALKKLEKLTTEEKNRLKNIKRVLQENRPMEADRDSVLGVSEALLVGVFRAPQLLLKVIDRVKELMASESLTEEDKEFMIKAQEQFDLKLPDVPTASDDFDDELKP